MKKLIYLVEVGILLPKENEEFKCYQVRGFFENECAFYDENRLSFFEQEQAETYARKYVKGGVNQTYAIVHTDIFNLDDKQIKSIEEFAYADDIFSNPAIESTLLFIRKENDKIIKGRF